MPKAKKPKTTRKRFHKKWDDPKLFLKVYEYARDGCTIPEIADRLGVKEGTFANNKTKNRRLSDAFKKGQEAAGGFTYQIAESALHKRIKGYSVTENKEVIKETKIKSLDGKETEYTLIEKTTTKQQKNIAPDITGIIFKLCNLGKNKIGNYESINKIVNEIGISGDNMNFTLNLESDEAEIEEEDFEFVEEDEVKDD